jgi:hypothetical protein
MSAVMIKVDLPNRPEGDLIVITGLGEFPNGEVSLVRMDVLAAYASSQHYVGLDEANWPDGVDVLTLDKEDLQLVYEAMVKKSKSDEAKAEAAAAPKASESKTAAPKKEGGN